MIPCRNEERIISLLLERIPPYVDEIIVVDNNSSDHTGEVAKKAGAKVLLEKRAVQGIGYGFVHQTGIHAAKGDYIVGVDGDDTYPTDVIKPIVEYMEKNRIDFISCNRLPLRRPHAISIVRQFGITILNMTVWVLYGYRIKDILSGMWVMNKKAKLLLHPGSGDWNFSPEIKLEAIRNPNISFQEYHIDHFDRANERSKQQIWKTGFEHLLFIVTKRFAF